MVLPSQRIRFCTAADGVRLAYALSGRGAPIVRAANWMTHIELDWQSAVWGHWLAELSRHNTLLRYDERGCGLSDWNVGDISFDAWIRDLEAVVDVAGLARFPLLGISRGGAIAIAYAVRHPERVSHLVLYGTAARGRRARAATPAQQDEADLMVKLAELGWGREDPAFRQVFSMQFLPEGTPEQHRAFNDIQRNTTSPENARRIIRAHESVDIRALLPAVACPTLVLHARRDLRVPFEEARELAALIPGARFVALESRNHILLKDEPAWQRWLDEVRDFLSDDSRADRSFPTLTPRERDVLDLIARGFDNAQIAARLALSEKTVRNHITSVFAKLEVESRAQAIVLARESGFGTYDRPAN